MTGDLGRVCYEFGPFRLDTAERLLYKGETIAPLSGRAFDILVLLVQRNGQIVAKSEIVQAVWRGEDVDRGALAFSIYKIRKALGENGPRQSYVVTVPGRGYSFVASARRSLNRVEISSTAPALAILPFAQVAANRSDEYMGVGIADALITKLASLKRLVVRPTSSVVNHHRLGQDAFEIGRKLRVQSVLDGNIRVTGDKMHIGVRLFSVAERSPVWVKDFDGDLFSVEASISEQVAHALIEVTQEERRRLIKRQTRSQQAYENYLKGRFHWTRRTADGTKKGIEFFERAIEKDPRFARAHSGLADCYSLLSFYSLQPPERAFPRARDAAAKALSVDDELPEAHTSMGYIRLYYDWDWVEAEKEFRRAIDLNPNYATAHHWYHEFLLAMGWFEEAMLEVKRAHELDPLSPVINAALVLPLIHAGQYDRAIDRLQEIVGLDPDFYRTHLFLGAAYTQKREFSKAISEFQLAMILSEGSTRALAALGYAYAVSGKKADARRVLDDLQANSAERYVSPYAMAMIHAGLGEKDEAFSWLEHAYELRDEWLVRLKIAPELNKLRADPRFTHLMRRVGLAP